MILSPRHLVCAVAALGAFGVAPATAATTTYGRSTLNLRGSIAAATGHSRIAINLAVTGGSVGAVTELRHKRSISIGKVRLSSLRVRLGEKATISALVGGRRVTLFVVDKVAAIDKSAGTARLTAGALRLTAAGARALSPEGRIAAGPAGSITTRAELPPAEPPVLARPATAVDVKTAAITRHVRDSFVRYINTGEGIRVANGATAGAATTSSESNTPMVYDYGFAFVKGWSDPVSGRLWLSFRGTVTFSYLGHGIDLDAKNPEIELTGSGSRAIFRFDGRHDTRPGNRRGVLAVLHPARVTPTDVAGTRTFAQIPATIPNEAASSVFAGYYLPGDPFGWFSVSLATG